MFGELKAYLFKAVTRAVDRIHEAMGQGTWLETRYTILPTVRSPWIPILRAKNLPLEDTVSGFA